MKNVLFNEIVTQQQQANEQKFMPYNIYHSDGKFTKKLNQSNVVMLT